VQADRVQEVSSWIHDEQGSCVTTQRIAFTFGMSRKDASAVLREAMQPNKSYQTTCIAMKEGSNASVVDLQKRSLRGNELSADDKLYAVSFLENTTEETKGLIPLATSVQKDALLFRSQIQSGQSSLVLNFNAIEISPSIAMPERKCVDEMQQARNVLVNTNNKTLSNKPVARKKATTAKTFFSKSASGKKVAATAKKPTHTSKNISKTKANKVNKPKAFGSSAPATVSEQEKENFSTSKKDSMHSTKTTKARVSVGTADDFIGDAEEDDDFLEEEEQRRLRNEEREKEENEKEKQRQRVLEKQKIEREEEEMKREKESVAAAPTAGKKRRKKLVEKTTMDDQGYMHTEMVAVWEEVDEVDVPSQKRVPKSNAAPKTKKNKGSEGMKQKTLMGFFAKK